MAIDSSYQEALKRRLAGINDSRSSQGVAARGNPVYRAGLPSPTSRGPVRGAQPGSRGAAHNATLNNRMFFGGDPNYGKPNAAAGQHIPENGQEGRMFFGGDPNYGTPNAAAGQHIPEGQGTQGSSALSGWSFDPTFSAIERRLFGDEAAAGSEKELLMRRLGAQKDQFMQNLGRGREQSLKSNTENMADRGLVHSGINVGQQGKIGEDYSRNISNLNQGFAQSVEDIERQHAANLQNIQQQREQLALDRSRQEQLTQLENAARQSQAEAAQAYQEAVNRTISELTTPSPTGQISVEKAVNNSQALPELQQALSQAVAAAQAHLKATGQNDPKLVKAAQAARQARSRAMLM